MNAHFPPARYEEQLPAEIQGGGPVQQPYDAHPYGSELEGSKSQAGVLLLKILGLALKYRILIFCCGALALLMGFVTTFLKTPIYSPSTTIKTIPRAPRVLKKEETQ